MHCRLPHLLAAAAFCSFPFWISTLPAQTASQPDQTSAENKAFPIEGILPKQEIGVARLLGEHPEYDGRGVTVAIFDTGVDPAAAGLQQTSDGRPKIVDLIDASGSGDVDTSTVKKLPVDGSESNNSHTLEGLTGRTLRLAPDWCEADREFHLGMKRGYELFPGGLVGRLKRERRKQFEQRQGELEAALRRELSALDGTRSQDDGEQKPPRAELQERLDQLQAAGAAYDDPGPIFDCLVFRDGDTWRAVVDTDEDGDLTDERLLTDYRAERQYGRFGNGAELSFAVNIYDDGNLLSIVTDSGAHGTHVAGIVAGYHPEQPELNGIAPGAQLVSVKIGDTRLDSMETGISVARAITAAVERNCDVINMSYGEPTSRPDEGLITDLIREAVHEHNVVFVASAGNSGPALSTVGAPGGTTSAVLGVGAYVSPAMFAAEHAARGPREETAYGFTSRGPTFDGDAGVDVFAPGGAIASVPTWTLSRSQQMSGTSMAAPSASGAVAVLLSAARQQQLDWTPHSIRRALQNTARPVPQAADAFTQGAGLIQLDSAWAYLQQHQDAPAERVRLEISVSGDSGRRGVYLREPHQIRRRTQTRVRIRPQLAEKAEHAERLDLQVPIQLQSTAEWVEASQFLLLTHAGDSFDVQVDPTELSAGVHRAEVQGLDAERPERGPLFRLPITVVVPESVSAENADKEGRQALQYHEQVNVTPGEVVRRFLAVPPGANWADLKLRGEQPGTNSRWTVHAMSRRSGQTFEPTQSKHVVQLGDHEPQVRSFQVQGGHTLELCFTQHLAAAEPASLDFELTFHGITPDRRELVIAPGEPGAAVNVQACRQHALNPQARLNTLRRVLKPAQSDIEPLDPQRDRLVDGRSLYELRLIYRFSADRALSVTPRFPEVDDQLYDAPFITGVWQLFNASGQLLATDDVWPGAVRIGKGDHRVELQLRHPDPKTLETMRTTPLYLDQPLSRAVSLTAYPSRTEALAGGSSVSRLTLLPGQQAGLYWKLPDSLPSETQPETLARERAVQAAMLLGTVHYGKSDELQEGSEQRPAGFPLTVVLPIDGGKKSESEKKTSAKKTAAALEQELLDLRLEQLKQFPPDGDEKLFEQLADEILQQHPNHLQVLAARLHRLDHESHRKQHLPEVVAAADAVVQQIDAAQLARDLGSRKPLPDAEQHERPASERRDLLVDALYRKGRALAYMELPEVLAEHPIADQAAHDKAFEQNFEALQRWVDTTDEKYFLLHIRRDRRKQRYGNALKLLNKYIPQSEPNYWYFKKRRDMYELLDWQHLRDYEHAWLLTRFPEGR